MKRFQPRLPLRFSLRGRVLFYTLLSTSLLGMVGLFSQLNTQIFLKDMVHIFQRNQVFLDLEGSMARISDNMESWLATKSSQALKLYWSDVQALRQDLRRMERQPFPDQASLIRKNIVVLTEVWLGQTEVAVNAKRGRNVQAYTDAFNLAERTAGFIRDRINQLSLDDFRDSIIVTREFNDQLFMFQVFNILMVVTLVGLGVVLGFWFSWKLTEPLDNLARAARKISEGSYDDAVVVYHREDEIGILAGAFDRMRLGVVRNIQALKEKAEVEQGLMQERLKNLRMKNLLKNAELQALQAQINPHFLFNTLNAGIQLAVIEDADQTRLFMENLADLMRHNIRRLDKPVLLSEELRNLESYLYILRIRFSSRFEFRIRLEPGWKDVSMPAMILQPLVENSLIHGLSDREDGGWVEIGVEQGPRGQVVYVADNGIGMDEARIQTVLHTRTADADDPDPEYREEPGNLPEADSLQRTSTHYSTGIGLGNVISRMAHFFGKKDLVSIESSPGQGCRISFCLPETQEV